MLKDITQGQFFPGNTIVHRLDPRTKILAVVLYIVALFSANSVLTYAILPDGEEAVATSEGRLSDALTPGSTAYLYWNPAQAAVIGGTSHGA